MYQKPKKPKCILVRGKPSSGKSTLARDIILKHNEFTLIDPDIVDVNNKEYSEFSPRQTKNPTENVKMYCFLYDKAERLLKNKSSVIWTQPWSRIAEIDLTIRNFGYYLTDLGSNVWKCNIPKIVERLPFNLYVIEVNVDDSVSTKRWLQNNNDKNELKRLRKTQKLFQNLSIDIPILKISGEENASKNMQMIVRFLNKN